MGGGGSERKVERGGRGGGGNGGRFIPGAYFAAAAGKPGSRGCSLSESPLEAEGASGIVRPSWRRRVPFPLRPVSPPQNLSVTAASASSQRHHQTPHKMNQEHIEITKKEGKGNSMTRHASGEDENSKEESGVVKRERR